MPYRIDHSVVCDEDHKSEHTSHPSREIILNDISIEIEKAAAQQYEREVKEGKIDADFIEIKRFDGGVAIVAVVAPLLASTLPFITKIVVSQINAKKHVVVKVKGIEIRGLDEASASRLIREIYEAKNK
jgi:hypothetical protein